MAGGCLLCDPLVTFAFPNPTRSLHTYKYASAYYSLPHTPVSASHPHSFTHSLSLVQIHTCPCLPPSLPRTHTPTAAPLSHSFTLSPLRTRTRSSLPLSLSLAHMQAPVALPHSVTFFLHRTHIHTCPCLPPYLSLAHTRPSLPPSDTPSLTLSLAHPHVSLSHAQTHVPISISPYLSLSRTHARPCRPPALLHSLSPPSTHTRPSLPPYLSRTHARDVPPLEAHTPSRDRARTHDSLRTREVAGQLRSPQPHTAAAGLRPAPARIRLQPGSARIIPALELACYRHTQALHACGGSGVIRALSPTACTPQARRFKMPHCHPRPPGHLPTRVRTHMS